MANYLMFDVPGTLPDINAGARRDKWDMVQVDAIHRTHIFNRSGTIAFQGFVPTDFQISLQSPWSPMLQSGSIAELASSLTGKPGFAALEGAIKKFGASTRTRALSAQMWQEPAYLNISLPIQITAYSDTKTEIIDKLITLAKFVSPSISPQGMLIAPGPVPMAEAVAKALQDMAGRGDGTSSINDDQSIVCQVGRFFRMEPCVITNVIAAFDGQPEHLTGNPLSVDFNLELTSYYAVTQEDIMEWFKGDFHAPR